MALKINNKSHKVITAFHFFVSIEKRLNPVNCDAINRGLIDVKIVTDILLNLKGGNYD